MSAAVAALDHLVLTVADIARTCDFYARALGVKVVRFGEGRVALHFGQQKINLHQTDRTFDPKAAAPTPGSADLCFLLRGTLEEAILHLRALAIAIEEGPVERTGAAGRIRSVLYPRSRRQSPRARGAVVRARVHSIIPRRPFSRWHMSNRFSLVWTPPGAARAQGEKTMKYGLLTFTAFVLAAPSVGAQGLWWVEGDRYCNDFNNRSRNGAMCGNPKKGESEPKPTYRFEFNTPRVPFIEDQQGRQGTVPAPSDRPTPTTAPVRGQQQQPRR